MSRPRLPFGVIGFAGVAGAAVLLLVLGAPRDRSTPRAAPTSGPAALTIAGVTLTSASADLPADDVALPGGPHRDLVEANCTACHSAAMIVSQPPLTREQWQATVEKMRKVYKAPVNDAAVPGIVTYLSSLSPSGERVPSHAKAGEGLSTARPLSRPQR